MTFLPTPVNLDRIRSLLTIQQMDFMSPGADVWSAPVNNALIFWSVENPQVLQIRGQWRGKTSTDEQFRQLRDLVLLCNSSRVAPKAFLLPMSDNRSFGLAAECNILINRGLTGSQFFGFCENSYTAIMSFFEEVESHMSELVTWDGPE